MKETVSASDPSQWIQCDRCKKWVSTLEDNITDLSLYDDNNPNHLEYFCPTCREEEEQQHLQQQQQRAKKRSSKRSSAKNTASIVEDALDEHEKQLAVHYQSVSSFWKKTEYSSMVTKSSS